MYAIIIADNLTNDYCSPEPQFQSMRVNIGAQEIGRLLGEDESYGQGVLPSFLESVVDAKRKGGQIGLILLRDYHDPNDPTQKEELIRYDEHSLVGSKGVEFIDPIQELVPHAEVINSSTLTMPLESFNDALRRIIGSEQPQRDQQNREQVKFLLVGFHTDKHILSTASLLRNVLGYRHVAVSPHLMASSSLDAHYTSLRYAFPDALIEVLPELGLVADFVGIDPKEFEKFDCRVCAIDPEPIRNALTPDQKKIIEVLCMHWTKAELRPLKGGFSGSCLFLANGWKGKSRAEPLVLKIDRHLPIRKELQGYERAKDLLGKNVPSIQSPVAFGNWVGISMELASMEGQTKTLQDHFEAAFDDESISRFLALLKRALTIFAKKLYGNTLTPSQFAPYRQFLLHIDQQDIWLGENINSILNQAIIDSTIDVDALRHMFKIVRKNDDTIAGQMCLAHGDLNLANIICDERDNIWAIDWTHAGIHPVEMDFAKLENDLKFALAKQFEPEDFSHMRMFEEHLLSGPVPPSPGELPNNLRFVKWDLRFKKILLAIRQIRETYFSFKENGDWLVYRVALLKYAAHTLSFDQSRGRGECGPVQLWYALASMEQLLFDLVGDDFHLKIRGERPSSYPARFRISLDQAAWNIPCPEYGPPYYVDPQVLQNDKNKVKGGWADSEENWQAETVPKLRNGEDFSHDSEGRPLNPRGRTGIRGRGALGRWGPNPMVLLIITRHNFHTHSLEILLHEIDNDNSTLIECHVKFNETFAEAVERALEKAIDLEKGTAKAEVLYEGYLYDARQTDHAWVVARCCLVHTESESASDSKNPGHVKSCTWKELSPKIVNQLHRSRAFLVREAVQSLSDRNLIARDFARSVLERTG
jgi:hypothetical protein